MKTLLALIATTLTACSPYYVQGGSSTPYSYNTVPYSVNQGYSANPLYTYGDYSQPASTSVTPTGHLPHAR
jgi:hypothetical protein